jgi:GR25 family glycosyltransferase involved in LPS biosynthesis
MSLYRSSNLVKRANALILKCEYSAALDLYRILKGITGGVAWDWQIRDLEKKLKLTRTIFYNQELGIVLRDIAKISHIYVANLVLREDRRKRVLTEFFKYGILLKDVSFVDAVHGALSNEARKLFENFKISDSAKYESLSGVPVEVLEHDRANSSLGAIGYLLTQNIIITDALKNGYRRILVFDDDVFFSSQAPMLAYQFFNKVNDWMIVHLGVSEHSPATDDMWLKKLDQANRCGFYNPIPYKTCGSFAVAYDSRILEKLLKLLSEYVGIYDRATLSYFYRNYPDQCYALRPAACCADVSESDIREAREMTVHALRMGWDISRYAEYISPRAE